MSCLARPRSRLESACRKPPVPVWKLTGRMATRAAGPLAGCVMLARVPLVTRNGELPGVNQGWVNHNPRPCCRCIRLRSGLRLFLPWAGMRSVFTGMTDTRAGFIRGIICGGIAFARSAAVLRKKALEGLRLSFSAHVAGANMGHPGRVVWNEDCQDTSEG